MTVIRNDRRHQPVPCHHQVSHPIRPHNLDNLNLRSRPLTSWTLRRCFLHRPLLSHHRPPIDRWGEKEK